MTTTMRAPLGTPRYRFSASRAWLYGAVVAVSLAIMSSVVAASAAEPGATGAHVATRLEPGLFALQGFDPALPPTDLAPLGGIIKYAQYVGLGEPIHTSGGIYHMKDRIFRYLVQEKGFRAMAIENPWISADHLQHYLDTCQGSVDDSMTVSLFGVWQATEVRDLLQWMCQWNQTHPTDRVALYGIDIQGQALAHAKALFDFLDQLGLPRTDARFADISLCDGVSATYFPRQHYPQPRYDRCQAALTALQQYFNDNQAWIVQHTSSTDLGWARVHLVGEQHVQEYQLHLLDPYGSPAFMQSYAARDRGMAYNVRAIHDLRFPYAKTAIWAANGHVMWQTGEALHGLDSLGNHLHSELGSDYAAVLMSAFDVQAHWGALGLCGHVDFADFSNPEIADPIETTLYNLGAGPLLVRMDRSRPHPAFLDVPHSIGDFWPTLLSDSFSALVYLDVSPGMHPIGMPSCPP